jgi:hypothetical protein
MNSLDPASWRRNFTTSDEVNNAAGIPMAI